MTSNAQPVVVGVDGSAAAVSAALWAVDEAVVREAPLRLVHAAGAPRPGSAPDDIAIEYGEAALRGASSAVAATGKAVKVETEILWGAVDETLHAESQDAAMVCVASVGIGWVAEKVLGSSAAALAQNAECPVVIVRYPPRTVAPSPDRWIVVGIDDRAGNEQIVTRAFDEAHLRKASVMAVATWSSQLRGVSYSDLDARCRTWSQRHPGVHVRPAATAGGLPEYLVEIRDRDIELVVLCAADAGQVRQIIGPHHRPLVPYGKCSVMVVH